MVWPCAADEPEQPSSHDMAGSHEKTEVEARGTGRHTPARHLAGLVERMAQIDAEMSENTLQRAARDRTRWRELGCQLQERGQEADQTNERPPAPFSTYARSVAKDSNQREDWSSIPTTCIGGLLHGHAIETGEMRVSRPASPGATMRPLVGDRQQRRKRRTRITGTNGLSLRGAVPECRRIGHTHKIQAFASNSRSRGRSSGSSPEGALSNERGP